MLDKKEENVNNSAKKEDGSIEFKFDAGIPKTALVFEESADAESEVELEKSAENEANDLSDIFAIAEQSEPKAENEPLQTEVLADENMRSVSDEEFIIPEIFDIAAESDSMPPDDYVSTIWKSYVPRFTDVTENQYHFANNGAKKETAANSFDSASNDSQSVNASAASSGCVIKVEQRDVSKGKIDYNDPTAEMESFVPDVVVVNINGKSNDKKDTINVFKFSDEKKENDSESPSPEELERRAISGLTGHKWEEEINPVSENNTDLQHTDDASNRDSESISDDEVFGAVHDEEDISVPLYSYAEGYEHEHESKESYVPQGYDSSSNAAANDTSEYNSFSMRDTFKDKFLDSIMASRIRLAVAVLLGITALVFNIFEKAICLYFGIGYNAMAAAIIDSCLIISLMLISMPEIVRAVKYLILGRVMPELSVALVGISLLAYTAAMVAIAPVGGYPLFSCVYAITVINSIFATNYLHSANFSAFRIVSEKGNKEIIDKPYTRTMELENSALDGAIDEYKSKIASLYTTPFVSGFFRNASKNSENSKNNLVIFASGFGVALVAGVVMFFLGGVVDAFAAFALVVSLALPAFSILSHKIPYKHAQKEAGLEKSAIIGERALYEHSAIDVVTFEDTEVFGPDDVTLKSASDRRSDYIDTMRKMACLFAALGGPLCRVFESALNKKYAPAENVIIEDDGVQGMVDGKSVMAGNGDYMKRHGVRIPNIDDKKAGSTRVIYAASEGEFFATFTVHYSFSEEFALTLSAMRENGIVPLVYTRDFNINNDFMRLLTGGSDVIRVMRKYTPKTEPTVYSKIDATMVTFGGKTAAINLILSSKRYAHFKSMMAITELTACLTGAALAAAIVLCNMMFSLPAALLAVWQLGWSVVLGIMSKKIFNPRKKEKRDAE